MGMAILSDPKSSTNLHIVICDRSLGETIKVQALRLRLTRMARTHADAQIAYWHELYAYELPRIGK